MAIATERVSDRTRTKGETPTATIAFDVVDAGTEEEALSASGIPNTGSSHPEVANLYAQNATAAKKGIRYWVVTVTYGQTPPDDSSNPINQKARIRWSIERISEAVDRDAYGNPLYNSVNDVIEGVTNDFYALRLDVLQYAAAFDIRRAIDYTGALNGDVIRVAGLVVNPLECLCAGIAPQQEQEEGSIQPVPILHSFLFRANLDQRPGLSPISAWDFRFLDQAVHGYYVDASQTTAKRPFYLGRDPVPVPVRLNGMGKPLEPNIKVGPEGFEAGTNPRGLPPVGAILDRMPRGGGQPEAVFLCYAKHVRLPFRGLVRYFK